MSDFELMLERKKEEKRKRRRRKVRAAMELLAPKSAPISATTARYLHLILSSLQDIDLINDNDDAIAKMIADMRLAARCVVNPDLVFGKEDR